ncbi:MAG: arginine--tRNA ligase [Rhodothalassiaceae bacterium]
MNLYATFAERIRAALTELEIDPGSAAVTVEPPRDPGHGDLATNAALVLAKQARTNPRDLADRLAQTLARDPDIAAAEVAGPGFINLRLSAGVWHRLIPAIIQTGPAYGGSALGAGRRVNVEYVSANPTGPMHVGHCRGAVVGDALANLLAKAGFGVFKEYYINDAGSQIDTLARSVHMRYSQALGRDIGAIPEGLYPGDYLIPVGEALAREKGPVWLDAEESVWLEPIKAYAVDAMMAMIRDDLAALGIAHELFFSERALHDSGRIAETIALMDAKGLIYEGVLEPPKGKTPEDWEPRPQKLFKATDFGDDVDRPLQKSDGAFTYFAADIAYHRDKLSRGFDHLVNIWGADHGGYVKRMSAAVKALNDGRDALTVKLCQMVKLTRGGEPVKMSKRAGTFVTLREVVEEVGRDVVRFMMLTRKSDAGLDFDFEKVLEQSRDNPVFYVQYAHARAYSAFRKAAEILPDLACDDTALAAADLHRLTDGQDIALIQRLAQWPRLIEQAAEAQEPHRVAFFLYDLASDFHSLWNRGNDDPQRRFVLPDEPGLTLARLALVRATALTLASGLAVLGVTPLTEL